MTRRPASLLLFLVFGLVLTACGGSPTSDPAATDAPAPTASLPDDEGDPSPGTASGTSTSTPSDVPQTAVDALDFTAVTVDGGSIDGSVHAGGDVALWMWAPW